ncbi:MAG: YbaB/EbfC family nucleoid-associated protein [Clostridiales bacterium]|jgi:DNA-binding YbaB/EbfC family protein|nr:YbaB/EbfC family nucleoid-associated protein [Clostridiales bacterium]
MAKGRGIPGGMNPMGGMNMNNLMKQAQKMQRDLERTQLELEGKKLEVSSGGGAVKITITGRKVIEELIISKDVVDPEDVEMLQDLVMTAVNEALRQAEELANSELGRLTGGMGLPGGLV